MPQLLGPAGAPTRLPLAFASITLASASVLVTGWLFVHYPGVLVSGVANPDPKGHVDFETFWRSCVALLHGADIYRTGSVLPNLNPPLLSLLLAPFGLLPALASYWMFTALTVALVCSSVLAAARELRLGPGATAFGLVTMLACSPLHGTLLLGQVYGLLLAGLTTAWLLERHGRPEWAAAVLGVVVSLKPSLAPVLLIPLVQRRWPAMWAGISSAAVASLLGVLAAGPASALRWLRLATGTPAPAVDANASLPGLVARLGGPGWVGWLATLAVVGGSLYGVRRAFPARPGVAPGLVGPADAALLAVTAGCLLAAPIAWLNYLVMLWPGALVLLRAGRWPAAVPLLVLTVVPVAWGSLWRAAPEAPAALAGRSLYCAVLAGFWAALLVYAAANRSPSRRSPARGTAQGRVGHRHAPSALCRWHAVRTYSIQAHTTGSPPAHRNRTGR